MPTTPPLSLGNFLAAVSILCLLTLPMVFVFTLLSVRRSLNRIAEALECANYSNAKRALEAALGQPPNITPFEGSISTSQFGR